MPDEPLPGRTLGEKGREADEVARGVLDRLRGVGHKHRDAAVHIRLGSALHLWADQFVRAVREEKALPVPGLHVVLAGRVLAGHRYPAGPVTCDGIRFRLGGKEVCRRRPAPAGVKALEELAIPHEAAGAVELAVGRALTGRHPLTAGDEFVTGAPVALVVTLEEAGGLFHTGSWRSITCHMKGVICTVPM